MLEAIRKFDRLIGPGRRGRWLLIVVLALVVTAVEAVAASLVYVLLSMVTDSGDVVAVPVVGDLPLLPGVDRQTLLLWVGGVIVAFFLLRGGLLLVQGYVQHRVIENTSARLSTRLLRTYLGMPYQFHLRRNSSEMIRNAFDTVQVITRDVFVAGVGAVTEAFVVVGIVAVLLVTVPLATALAVGTLGPVVYLVLRFVNPKLTELGETSQEMSNTTLQALQQGLQGVRDIKVVGREAFFRRDFARSRALLARTRYIRAALKQLPRVLIETTLVLFIVAFFAVTVILDGSAAHAVPVLGLFAYAAMRVKPSLNAAIVGLNAVKFAAAAIDDVHADLELEQEDAGEGPVTSQPLLPFTGELRLEHVGFRYPGTSELALDDISLSIAPGESIGIVGPTGGGKSTLIDLLLGLLEPTSGAVLVDGVDIRGHKKAWQRNLGMVPQNIFLIDDTLRRNIALGLDDDAIDEGQLDEAVRMAQLEGFVQALPQGLDTVVGERGVRLSGGQRQRVAIARALYRRPSVVVFDEGTSALDNQTEAELMGALSRLRGQRTMIVVAHRLSTVRQSDRILVLRDGRVVATGAYDELATSDPEFRQLLHAQPA